MKLKELELYGFKSFADRTSFQFEEGLSALVGPNGSGKSNVADAIKWVLGERSAHRLRGSEMASVIFSGSEGRKPVNFAEVKLTIDNSDGWLPTDHEEVCIRRRVDHSGQSDYFLNGEQARLKDIRHLLLDTGVGTDAYSFIEQGQIDQLLRSSPRERREVFDEAAGINRFLEQKRQAERKLERVDNNLARTGDLVEELERQLRSVKYQAGRARTFKRQTERLQLLRLAHGLHRLRELEERRARHREQIGQAQERSRELQRQAEQTEAERERRRKELEQGRAEQAADRQRLARVETRLESLDREDRINRKRRQELQQHVGELDERREALQGRLGGLEEEIASARRRLQQGSDELEEKAAAHRASQQQTEELKQRCSRAQEELEARKSEVFDLFQRASRLRNQAEVLAAEKRALQSRLERSRNRQQALRQQIDETEAARTRAGEKLDQVQMRREEARQQLERLRTEADEADRQLAEIAEQETDTKAELSGCAGRREVLEDLEERAEGIRSGARHLLQADLPGTVGLVAQGIDAPMELAAAVEAALGERVQAVIFRTARDASGAVKALLSEQTGRAELIVLDCLPTADRTDLPAGPGVRGPLAELVECSPGAAEAVEFLLRGVLLVEDADAARRLVRGGLPRGIRLVTPRGERFDAEGLWAAGAAEAPGLISRRSELAELRAGMERLRADLEALSARKEKAREKKAELAAGTETLEAGLTDLERDANQIESHLQTATARSKELREELRLTRAEIRSLEEDVADIAERCEGLQRKCEQARAERKQAQEAVQEEQRQLSRAQQRRQEAAERAAELSTELARSREQKRNLESTLERLRSDREQRKAELASLELERQSSLQRREEAAEALAAARDECERLREEKDELEKRTQERSGHLADLGEAIEELGAAGRELTAQREEVAEQLQQARMAENETAVKIQDLLDRTEEDYGVRLGQFRKEPDSWRERSPFVNRVIREFSDQPAEPPPVEPVAQWYRELEDGEGETEPEEGPEPIDLEEATALRADVLELADCPDTDWEELRAEVSTLKAKVDRIGNVNVAAIRQQEELETRLQFLTDQREDLEKAKRHQRQIIGELKKKSRERFRQTFQQVSENFQSLFRKLFGGGAADLRLEEEAEDILEAGIEMVARPPGKETTSISLLSGGERALTTVALLFGIFQAKPSPFCLLDEVDAPLDDSNLERFLMLLEEFREDTQFIIITHNKLTMGVAEVLYGLTMADGVSKKISVKFDEVDRAVQQMPRAKAG